MIEIEAWKLAVLIVSGPVITSLVWWLGLREERRQIRRLVRNLEAALRGGRVS